MAKNARAAKPRRTQEERSAQARARLLDATIESLVEIGYARTTSAEVAERSGLSRGAQLHHFPTKADLVEAAVEQLAKKLAKQHRDEASKLPRRADRAEACVDLMWSSAQGPLFAATLELLVAARTDPQLRSALDRFYWSLRDEMATTFLELFGEDANGGTAMLLELSLAFINGLALETTVNGSIGSKKLLNQWKQIIASRFDT